MTTKQTAEEIFRQGMLFPPKTLGQFCGELVEAMRRELVESGDCGLLRSLLREAPVGKTPWLRQGKDALLWITVLTLHDRLCNGNDEARDFALKTRVPYCRLPDGGSLSWARAQTDGVAARHAARVIREILDHAAGRKAEAAEEIRMGRVVPEPFPPMRREEALIPPAAEERDKALEAAAAQTLAEAQDRAREIVAAAEARAKDAGEDAARELVQARGKALAMEAAAEERGKTIEREARKKEAGILADAEARRAAILNEAREEAGRIIRGRLAEALGRGGEEAAPDALRADAEALETVRDRLVDEGSALRGGLTASVEAQRKALTDFKNELDSRLDAWQRSFFEGKFRPLAECYAHLDLRTGPDSPAVAALEAAIRRLESRGEQEDAGLVQTLVDLGGNLKAVLGRLERAMAPLGLFVYRPQPGSAFDPEWQGLAQVLAEDEEDPPPGTPIERCVSPGISWKNPANGDLEPLLRAAVRLAGPNKTGEAADA